MAYIAGVITILTTPQMIIFPIYKTRQEILKGYGVTPDSDAGRWRISALRKEGYIVPVSRTWCRVGPDRRFHLRQTSRDIQLVRVVRPLVDSCCVWSLTSINPLLVHQRTRRLTLVEVARADRRLVFERLRSERIRNVILETDTKWVIDHIGESDFDVVVRTLVGKSPLEDAKKGIPSLEKIIVDLFVDGQVLLGVAQSDLTHLVRMAFSEFCIDVRVMRSYARRRATWDKLVSFIEMLQFVPSEVLRDP